MGRGETRSGEDRKDERYSFLVSCVRVKVMLTRWKQMSNLASCTS